VDGQGSLVWAERYAMGRKKGMADAASIIQKLERDDNGKIIESIKFVTNSMGAATQRGYSQGMKDYIKSYNEGIDALLKSGEECGCDKLQGRTKIDVRFESNTDLSALEGNLIPPDPNVESNYFMRNKVDLTNPNTWGPSYEEQKVNGAIELGVDSNGNPTSKGHHAKNFDPKAFPIDSDKTGGAGQVTNEIENK